MTKIELRNYRWALKIIPRKLWTLEQHAFQYCIQNSRIFLLQEQNFHKKFQFFGRWNFNNISIFFFEQNPVYVFLYCIQN